MQTSNRFMDDMAKLAAGAAGAFQGMKGEMEQAIKGQLERLLTDMNLVTRDEFDAVKAMAAEARAENERQAARIAELEAKLRG